MNLFKNILYAGFLVCSMNTMVFGAQLLQDEYEKKKQQASKLFDSEKLSSFKRFVNKNDFLLKDKKFGERFLIRAIDEKNVDMVKFLVENGVRVILPVENDYEFYLMDPKSGQVYGSPCLYKKSMGEKMITLSQLIIVACYNRLRLENSLAHYAKMGFLYQRRSCPQRIQGLIERKINDTTESFIEIVKIFSKYKILIDYKGNIEDINEWVDAFLKKVLRCESRPCGFFEKFCIEIAIKDVEYGLKRLAQFMIDEKTTLDKAVINRIPKYYDVKIITQW